MSLVCDARHCSRLIDAHVDDKTLTSVHMSSKNRTLSKPYIKKTAFFVIFTGREVMEWLRAPGNWFRIRTAKRDSRIAWVSYKQILSTDELLKRFLKRTKVVIYTVVVIQCNCLCTAAWISLFIIIRWVNKLNQNALYIFLSVNCDYAMMRSKSMLNQFSSARGVFNN